MADTRTDTELLAELGPLAAVIADKIRTVPVRIGPGGADDLISELTIAVAVYCGKHVLPADALALANPPLPPTTEWIVEIQWHDGGWQHFARLTDGREQVQEAFAELAARDPHAFRLIRATTTYAVEAEHTPEQQP
ncbi:hypothetical protein ACVHNB_32725 [Streptomyces sp. YJ-C3]